MSRFKITNVSKLLVSGFLILFVVAPMINLILGISVSDIKSIVGSAQFTTMLKNSLITTAIATIISVMIAYFMAMAINRTNMKYKSIFTVLFTLPMLIPSISHGLGLVLLFGDNGLITNFLGINIGLFGSTGIVLGSVLYSFPVAFLLLNNIFQYEDYTAYEAATVLGLSKWQQFKTITLPNFTPTLVATVFAVFTMIFTDYGVPLIVGGKMMTLPVYMYREVIGLLNFSKGGIIGVILLLPAVIAFIFDLRTQDQENASTVVRKYQVKENRVRDHVVFVLCLLIVVLVTLPILMFIYLSFVKQYPINLSFTFDNIRKALNIGIGTYLLNSITIALATAIVGTASSYLTAYLTARSSRSFSTMALHMISLLSLAIPGVVLGLSYVLFFNGTAIYQTLLILLLVNVVHFFASPYLMAYNTLKTFNTNLEDISSSLGVSRFRMLMDVYIPSTQETIIEMFSYMFVNAMVTISAVSFLANLRNMPLSMLIPQLDSQGMIEATAIISVVILLVNILIKAIVYSIKRFRTKEEI